MIKLITNITIINNDIADIIRLFYSFEKITYLKSDKSDFVFTHEHLELNELWTEKIVFSEGVINKEYIYEYTPTDISTKVLYKRHLKRSAKHAFYNALKDLTGKSLPWGSLTGIRPTRLFRMLDNEYEDNAHNLLLDDYDVSKSKLDLLENIIESQSNIFEKDCRTSVDLYIGIPFCPTRCEYCSFISFDMSKGSAPLDEYVGALIKEIIWFNNWRKKNNKELRSVYIGGGTPTSIGRDLLQDIIQKINIDNKIEFTVEAGRPDTINSEMLKMLSDNNVNRISINPQSMNDETLYKMKRPHSANDIKETFKLARQFDFIINMDLILGLEGETIQMLSHTLDEVEKMDIDNLTIHTLAVKRSSKLKENIGEYHFTDEDTVSEMVDLAHSRAYKIGMHPYYMYRQKYMSGNLENVGFAKNNKDCIYNIDIMEETHNLVALGAGAVSKRKYFELKKHVRFANHKSISHYIENIDSQLLKKDDFFAYN